MKYYIYYVIDSTPHLDSFKTKKELNKFIIEFDTNGGEDWIDYTFYGKLINKPEYM